MLEVNINSMAIQLAIELIYLRLEMLAKIETDRCPYCNAEIRREVKEDQHCNGYWNETRTFKCGYELHFSPNFMRILTKKECPNSDKMRLFYSKREKALYKIKQYILRLDTDKEFIEYILEKIKYISSGR